MSDRVENRAAISALLRAGKTVKAIVDDVGCSRALVYKVKNRVSAGKSPQVTRVMVFFLLRKISVYA